MVSRGVVLTLASFCISLFTLVQLRDMFSGRGNAPLPLNSGESLGPPATVETVIVDPFESARVEDWEPSISCPKAKHSKPVHSLFFYALHKTGSTKIREVLNTYCDKNGLECFAPESNYRFCPAGNITAAHCRQQLEPWIDFGTSTHARIRHCCGRYIGKKFDGLIGHLSMNDPPTAKWVSQALKSPHPFRLTFIRNAVDVFESYFHNLPYYQYMKGMPFNDLVDALFEAHFVTANAKLDGGLAKWYHMLVNSQSKEMGWDGHTEASFRRVLEDLTRIDFVGIAEKIQEGAGSLEIKLGWPHKYFAQRLGGNKTMTVYKHDPAIRYKILLLQDKDRRLYKFAKKVYDACHKFPIP